MANDVHKIKLLLLWDILCKNTDEDHALNTDEIANLLALRGVNVSRKILVQDIATLCDNGYEVLSYKKRYHYYYVVNRALETAEVVMLADVINASKLPAAQKKALAQRLAETLCSHQAENISKHIVSLDKGRKGTVRLSITLTQSIVLSTTTNRFRSFTSITMKSIKRFIEKAATAIL